MSDIRNTAIAKTIKLISNSIIDRNRIAIAGISLAIIGISIAIIRSISEGIII